MLKKTIAFKDLDGNPVTEEFCFHMSPAEMAELELSHHPEGWHSYLEKAVTEDNKPELLRAFQDLIRRSVGRRSEDNRRFEKSEEIANNLLQSDAYSVLFLEIGTSSEKAAEFLQGIVPADLSERMAELAGNPPKDPRPLYVQENRRATREEFAKMSPSEQAAAFAFTPTP